MALAVDYAGKAATAITSLWGPAGTRFFTLVPAIEKEETLMMMRPERSDLRPTNGYGLLYNPFFSFVPFFGFGACLP